MKYRYEVGDRIVITDMVPRGLYEDHCHFAAEMEKYLGFEAVITERWMPAIGGSGIRRQPRYTVDCDCGEWTWIENWLLPYDQPIEFEGDISSLL